jgi:hypothetical protein
VVKLVVRATLQPVVPMQVPMTAVGLRRHRLYACCAPHLLWRKHVCRSQATVAPYE